MRTRALFLCAFILTQGFGSSAFGAGSLDELLQQTRSVREGEIKAAEELAAQYKAASAADQAKMLADATAARDDLAARAKALSDQFSNNEIQINGLNDQLRQKATQLGVGEVFGLARQTASDVVTILQQSLITAQFPAESGEGREAFLRSFAEAKTVPSPAELERLWLEIQREMTESGKVVRFNAKVVQPNGDRVDSQVTRIGPFIATAGGNYLGFLPELQSLNVLPRQLPTPFMEVAAALENASGEGYVRAVVDSARGVLLALYIERPTFEERIELGEEVGYVIIAVGLFSFIAFVFQLFYLIFVRIALARQMRNLNQPVADNPLGRVLLAFKGDPKNFDEEVDIAELRISEAVLHEVPKLERFQALLRLAVAAGPLLGLIGTVVGMIITFQSITESGSSDPKLMATGIGQAMIATVLGLGIAIPLLFANAGLQTLSRSMIQILDEQSAGLLAESLEKRRRA